MAFDDVEELSELVGLGLASVRLEVDALADVPPTPVGRSRLLYFEVDEGMIGVILDVASCGHPRTHTSAAPNFLKARFVVATTWSSSEGGSAPPSHDVAGKSLVNTRIPLLAAAAESLAISCGAGMSCWWEKAYSIPMLFAEEDVVGRAVQVIVLTDQSWQAGVPLGGVALTVVLFWPRLTLTAVPVGSGSGTVQVTALAGILGRTTAPARRASVVIRRLLFFFIGSPHEGKCVERWSRLAKDYLSRRMKARRRRSYSFSVPRGE